VVQVDDGSLVCLRCDTVRPPVCLACGAGRFANLRPGVGRLREELEAAANRPAVLITGDGPDRPAEAGVYVGTEAALHRVDRADTVAFLDFDRELLAPATGLRSRRWHCSSGRRGSSDPADRGGRILVQTFLPHHDVIQAALLADPGRIVEGERERRRHARPATLRGLRRDLGGRQRRVRREPRSDRPP
jgi:primosomal protein N' (replication factor Y) (superfamily II helicase)